MRRRDFIKALGSRLCITKRRLRVGIVGDGASIALPANPFRGPAINA
jgi:hypothetical protein